MEKHEKLQNLDWLKIRKLVIKKLPSAFENVNIKINQTLGSIERSNGQKVSFGGFDEFWSCNVESQSYYLHVQIDCSKFIDTRTNNVIINVNFWGMNGKKLSLEVNINEIISLEVSTNT
jgi:hypothetical protein